MKSTCLLFALAPIIHGSTAFSSSSIHISKKHRKHPNAFKKANHANIISNIFQIRAGDTSITYPSSTTMSSMITPVTEALNQALVSGTPLRAIGALYAVASLTVVPLTYIRQAYSFSVGYGLSVATMAVALLSSFAFSDGIIISFSQIKSIPSLLALNALVYGLRLSGFLLTREYTVESKKKQFRDLDKTPRFKRTPLALGVSLLYSFMTSPLLFALRGVGEVVPSSNAEKVQLVFTGISIFGMLLEAVADQHKYLVKKQGGKEGEDKFVGPTSWSYKLCRHPNYFGEILFWLGLFGAGSVSFGKSVIAWVCGSLGLWGILSIMLGASSRLDKKQNEKYGGQVAFEEWKKEVNSSVVPLIK